MTRWEPLPDTMSENARRLAIQLRRMKDRSGLGVPTIAVRTAQSTEAWERYLNGGGVPPRDAVEALGQLCGADYDRLGALWELAERGGGTHVPDPDPLDPLSAAEGLPKPPLRHRWRKPLLVGGAGLALAALWGLVVLTGFTKDSGAGTGRAGGAPKAAAASTARSSARPASQRPGTYPAATSGADTGAGAARMSGTPGAAGSEAASTAPVGVADPSTPPATASATPTAPASAPVSSSATPSVTATATATTGGGLCLGVIILNVCIG